MKSNLSAAQLEELIKSIQAGLDVNNSFKQIIIHYDAKIRNYWDIEIKSKFSKGSQYKPSIVSINKAVKDSDIDASKKIPYNNYLSCVHFGLMRAILRFKEEKGIDLWSYAVRFIRDNVSKETANYPPASGIISSVDCKYKTTSDTKLIDEYTCGHWCECDPKYKNNTFDYVNIYSILKPCKRKPIGAVIDLERDRGIVEAIYKAMEDGDESAIYDEIPHEYQNREDNYLSPDTHQIDSRLATKNGIKRLNESIKSLPLSLQPIIKDLVAPSKKVKIDSTSYVKKKYQLTPKEVDLAVMEAVKIIKSSH